MKNTKLIALILLLCLCTFSFSVEVYLLENKTPPEKYKTLGDILYVHAVTLLDAIGARYEWNNASKTLVVNWNQNSILFSNNSQTVLINNSPAYISNEPLILDNRFFLPLLETCKLFGLRVVTKEGQVHVFSEISYLLYYFSIPDGYAFNFQLPVNFVISEQSEERLLLDVYGSMTNRDWFLTNARLGIDRIQVANSTQDTLKAFIRFEIVTKPDRQAVVTQENGTLWIRTQNRVIPEIVVNTKNKIVIDPGHGGIDPGAIGNRGTYEKNVVLSLSKAVKSYLEKNDFIVYLTRENDVFVDLKQRAIFANNKGADLFVSLHLNSFEDISVQGVEVYYYPWSEESYKIRLNRLYGALSEETVKVKVQRKLLSTNQSKKYAENIRDTLQKSGLSIRKVIPGDFAVIAYTEMPAVLIECGYISNSNFERDLQKPEVLNLLAENIAKSIQNLF